MQFFIDVVVPNKDILNVEIKFKILVVQLIDDIVWELSV